MYRNGMIYRLLGCESISSNCNLYTLTNFFLHSFTSLCAFSTCPIRNASLHPSWREIPRYQDLVETEDVFPLHRYDGYELYRCFLCTIERCIQYQEENQTLNDSRAKSARKLATSARGVSTPVDETALNRCMSISTAFMTI